MENENVIPTNIENFTKTDWIRAGIGWITIAVVGVASFKAGKRSEAKRH